MTRRKRRDGINNGDGDGNGNGNGGNGNGNGPGQSGIHPPESLYVVVSTVSITEGLVKARISLWTHDE